MSEAEQNVSELTGGHKTFAFFAAAVLCLAACTQEPPPPTEPVVETATSVQGATEAEAPVLPDSVPPSTEVNIERIEGIMLSRSTDQPGTIVIYASGLVSSRGWTNPRLVPAGEDEANDTLSLSFVATSPDRETPPSDPQPVEALIEVSALAPEVESVRIIGATNELTAPVSDYP